MSIPKGCRPMGYLWCCQFYDDINQGDEHIIGHSYMPFRSFEVDGITYDPRTVVGAVTIRAMFELIDPR